MQCSNPVFMLIGSLIGRAGKKIRVMIPLNKTRVRVTGNKKFSGLIEIIKRKARVKYFKTCNLPIV